MQAVWSVTTRNCTHNLRRYAAYLDDVLKGSRILGTRLLTPGPSPPPPSMPSKHIHNGETLLDHLVFQKDIDVVLLRIDTIWQQQVVKQQLGHHQGKSLKSASMVKYATLCEEPSKKSTSFQILFAVPDCYCICSIFEEQGTIMTYHDKRSQKWISRGVGVREVKRRVNR